MISRVYNYIFLAVSIVIASVQTCDDFSFDYETHPDLPFHYEHLELDITVNGDQTLIGGIATYTMSPKIDGLTEIPFHAGDLAIESVEVDGYESDFSITETNLIIQLTDTLQKGEEIQVSITWQSNSKFGLFRDYQGSLWTSKNPLAHRHWLPTYDHPRVQLSVDAFFDIPNETEIMFNGNLVETIPVSENRKRVHWQTEKKISITSAGFVHGDFVISEMTAGFTKIRLFTHEFNFPEEKRAELIVEAARLKREIEDELSFEYPWEGLNIVVLPDNYWEERTHGSGTIYLYDRLGSLKNQLKRGLYTQWFGEYQTTEEYFSLENDGINELLPAVVHFSIENDKAYIQNPDTLFKIDYWNTWQEAFPAQSSLFKETLSSSLPGLMREFKGIISFDDYAENWYETTGISWFTPDYSFEKEIDSLPGEPGYTAEVFLDEVDFELTVAFELVEGEGDELYSLNLNEYQFESIKNQEINFTGIKDTVRISLDPATEFITFSSGTIDIDNVEWNAFPLYFLLNQLRSEDPDERAAAAVLLKSHSENPDLQLALSDILNFEEDPIVIATVYETLAEITDGAIGTEEQFLSGLNNSSRAIQLASINALANYPENDFVKSTLRSTVLRADNDSVFHTALEVYQGIASKEEMFSLAENKQRADSIGLKVLTIIERSDSLAFDDEVNDFVEGYLAFSFPYEIRSRAYFYLNKNDLNVQKWSDRIRTLIEDRDPRMRIKGYEAIPVFKSTSEALVFLNTAEVDEFDVRVLLLVDELKNSLSEE
ncbi:MAG: hypothetical protein MI700_09625 [Balneolales bacterium]|nr:hypothetical protein [Balneolales bacterium]